MIFRNEIVKLLSEIQSKAEEHKKQVTTTQQVTTFQLPEATQATAGPEYILTIPDTQPASVTVVQPTQIAAPQPATVIAKVQQPQRSAYTLTLNTWRSKNENETVNFLVEYSPRLKNARDRSQQLNWLQATQATAGPEYILTIPDTQPVSAPVVQPSLIEAPQPAIVIAKVQHPQRSALASSQPASVIVVDDLYPGSSRQLMFVFSPTKTFNPLTVPSRQQKDSQQNTSEVLHPYCSTSRSTHSSHFQPLNFNKHRHQCQLTLSKNKQDLPASPASSQTNSAD